MKGTPFLGTAYYFGMELFLLIFLLSQNGNGDLKRSLNSFLEFYRENRELLGVLKETLSGDLSAPPKQNPEKKPEAPRIEPRPQDEKNRPQEGIGDVLENYLRRAAL